MDTEGDTLSHHKSNMARSVHVLQRQETLALCHKEFLRILHEKCPRKWDFPFLIIHLASNKIVIQRKKYKSQVTGRGEGKKKHTQVFLC